MNTEPFNWSKLWGGFMTGVGWVKAASLAVRVVMIVVALGIPMYAYHKGAVKGEQGKAQAVAESYTKGYSQAMTDHPPQVYNAPATVNNNPIPKPVGKIGISAFGWTLGACHL